MNTIILRGKEYPILFDLTAVEQIQKRYGNIADVVDKLQDMGEICWIISTVINEGQKLQALEYGIPAHPLSPEEVSTLLTLQDMNNPQLIDALVNALNDCLGHGKNLTAEQLILVGKTMLTNQSTSLG